MKSKVKLIHIGKKAPKGFKEVAGSIHLGKGIWALKCESEDLKSRQSNKENKNG
jgi:hypothetical protein